MADAQANIGISLDTSQALAQIRQLQREISAFHTLMAKGGANVAAESLRMRQGLINSINETGKFSANMTRISSSTESFTNALEKNKFSMTQYFRYAGASTKTFGKLFTREFDTINRVATERVKDLQTQYISMGRDANGALQAIKVRPLALDMQNLSTRTMLAAQKQQLFNQLLKQGSTNLLNFGKNTQWAGRQLMVGFTIPLTIFGVTAAREFQKLEEQAIRFKRVYGDMFTTSGQTEKALENIKELASEFTKYGIAVEETVGLAAKVAQMGNMGDALESQVRQATRLSVLGGIEQQEALDTTISLTNAFGIATEDLADKINFLNAAENQTILSIEDFNTAIPKAGSVVRALGGDVEDLAFFLTAMREGGIEASQGANAIKTSLGRLINPTEAARKRLSALGIDVVGIVEANAGNLRGTVLSLAQALDTLEPLERSRAIEQLFGKFQFARMSTMFKNIVDEGSQANKVLQLTANSTQELGIIAERELGRVEDSVAYKFQKSLEEFKAALAPLGGEFLKAVTPLVEFGTKILNKFNEMGDGAKQFIVIMGALLGAVGPVALMSFGLLANGVANVIKMFANLGLFYQKLTGQGKALGMSTQYMTQEQIEASAVAASLNQSHATLIQTFGVEAASLERLTAAYQKAIAAQKGFQVSGAARGSAAPAAKGLSSGILSVPGPKGAGDIVPAMLSPGEAVIPADKAQKYSGFIRSILYDKIPGFFRGVFLGMPKSSAKVAKHREASDLIASRFVPDAGVPLVRYGHQIAPTTGHSFPISGVGGAYTKADGSKVFVKPFVDRESAIAEMRAGQIAREAHGLLAPKHTLVRIPDPTDLSGKRTFYALESKLDPRFANPTGKFTKGEMIKQLLASLLRADKDLSPGNLYGRVLTDPGPGGVYTRASGYRSLAKPGELPSLAQQAEINLLGVKGGARKFFAQATSDLARSMTPQEYQRMMLKEIDTVLPRLKKTIASFNLKGPEKLIYDDMIKRLEAGRTVDWARFHKMHSDVPALPTRPIGLANGIVSVPGPKGAGDVVPAMLSPGEAVIPARQAKKHGSLINDLINNRIPGYETGLEAEEKTNQRKTTRAPKAIARPPAGTFQGYTNAVMLLETADNSALNTGTANAAELSKKISTRGAALQAPIADGIARALTGANTQTAIQKEIAGNKNIQRFAQNVNNGIAKGINDWAVKNPGKTMGDADFGKIARGVVNKELNRGGKNPVYNKEFKGAVRNIMNKRTMFSDTTNQRIRRKGKFWGTDAPGRDTILKGGLDYRRKYSGAILALGGDPNVLDQPKRFARSHITKPKPVQLGKGSFAQDKLSTPAAAALSRSQQGLVRLRLGKVVDKVVKASKLEGPGSKVQKALAALGLSVDKNNNIVDKNNKVVASGTATTKKDNKATAEKTKQTKKASTAQKENTKAVAKSTDRVVANTKAGEVVARTGKDGRERFFRRQEGRLRQISQAEAQRAINRSEGGRKAAETRAANRAVARDATKPSAGQNAADAAARSRLGPGAVMGGLAGVAMIGAMGASFAPGKIGEVAQQLLFPLMMLPMILPLLKNPIVLAIAAVAALGGSILLLHKKLKDATKAGVDAAQAMSMTAEKAKSISEVTGTISATELRRKQQEGQLTGGGPEFSSFGLSFLQDSEQGKAMLEDIEKQFTSGRTMDEVGANIGRQLAMAISQGVLSVDQARSIASALGAELGDYSISMDISGKLTELLGVEGSDLLKNPLEIAIRIKEDSMKEQALAFEQTISALDFESAWGVAAAVDQADSVLRRTGEALKAAGAAAAVMSVGAIALSGGAATPVAAPAGVIGVGLYGLGGVLSTVDQSAQNNELAGAALQLGVEQLAQNQMLVDSINGQYDAQINQLTTQLAIVETEEQRLAIQEEIRDLEDERRGAILEINKANADTTSQILAQAKTLDDMNLYENAIGESVRQRYADGPMKVFADEALKNLKEMDDQDFAMALNLQMATGELNPISVLKLIEAGAENENLRASFTLGMKLQGSAQMNQLMQLLTQTGMNDTRFAIMLDFIVNKEGQEFNDALEALAIITNAEARYPINIDIEGSDGEDILNGVIANLEKYRDMPDTMTKEAFVNIAQGDAALTQIVDKWDDLGLTDNIYRQFVIDFLTLDANADRDLVAAYMADQGISPSPRTAPSGAAALGAMGGTGMESNMPTEEDVARLGSDAIVWAMKQRAQAFTSTEDPGATDSDTGDSGGGKESFDRLLTGLRNTRQATIDMKRGWDGMQESLQKFLDSGVTGFNGLANQMRRLGVGEGLIERITGMDPDEYEKRKGELFVFDEAGNIVGTTQKLQNLSLAMNSLALGEYINTQQQFIENTQNQFTAMQKLTAEGLSFVEAYEMVQDQALATAIAMGISKEETAELIRITRMMQEMKEKYNRVSEEEQAAKAVRQTNKEFNNRVAVLNKLASQQGKYTDEQISAILNDNNLSTLFLNPKIDSKTLSQALENARRAADLELQIKVTTEEGKKGLFDELVAEVQDEFNRQEAKIDIEFRLANKDDQNIVNEAQNQIAAIQYQVDDYEAQLKGIEDQEEVINDKYAERYEALEEVAAANERIQRIRSAELDIADALSRGDIAAAARAQQELRATEAQNRAESQKEMLQRQQEAELARVRSESGMSRTELEDKIKALQDEIFGIEEDSLEPAQERLRIAEYEKQLQVDALEVSGRTRDEWNQIANLTDIATQNTEEFAKNVERALALYEYFVNDVPLPLDLFGGQFDDQLRDMGIEVEKERERSQVFETNQAIGRGIDEAIEEGRELTSVEQKALELAKLNDTFERVKQLREEADQLEASQVTSGQRPEDATTITKGFFETVLGTLEADNRPIGLQSKVVYGSGSPAQTAQEDKRIADLRREADALIQENRNASRDFALEVFGSANGQIAASADSLDRAYQSAKQSIINKAKAAGVPVPQAVSGSSGSGSGGSSSRSSSSSTARRMAQAASTAVAQKAGVNTKYTSPDAAERSINSYVAKNPRAAAVTASKAAFEASGMSLRAYMRSAGGIIPGYAIGGKVKGYAAGGFQSLGSDNIPAMLTPGEFVVRKRAVQDFGLNNLEAINNGEYSGGSVYNYNLAVNVKSDADPDRIARTVMRQIQRVDSQKVRGNRL